MFYPPPTLEESRAHLRELIEDQQHPRPAWELAVMRTADQRLLGAFDLTLDDNGGAGLGYLLGRFAWGQGYATEAARAVVGQGFETLKLDRIHALCHREHQASARVLEKAGLVREALLEQHCVVQDEPWDMWLYSRTRDSWLAVRP